MGHGHSGGLLPYYRPTAHRTIWVALAESEPGLSLHNQRTLAAFKGSILLTLFSLEGVEIVIFAFILVLFRNRYTNGSEQLPVLLGPHGE